MKRNILLGTVLLAAGSLLAADLKDEVTSAGKQLASKDNYSWKQTTANAGGNGGGGGFGGGASQGKTDKAGLVWVSREGRDGATIESVRKGEKGAVKGQDGWQSLEELRANAGGGGGGGGGRGGFMGMMMRNFKAPAVQAQDLAAAAKELKKDGDVVEGDLTEDGAKAQLSFGGRPGGNGPEISGAKGSVKFWLKDGVIAKYELKVKGTISFNGNDRDVDRTTTVEIKDVGTTKIELSDEAKKKLE
jgi:hypothetical protein